MEGFLTDCIRKNCNNFTIAIDQSASHQKPNTFGEFAIDIGSQKFEDGRDLNIIEWY